MRQRRGELVIEDRESVVQACRMEARGLRWALALTVVITLFVCAGMAGPRAPARAAPAAPVAPTSAATPASNQLPWPAVRALPFFDS